MAEFYVHGSRAVVDRLLEALSQIDNMQPAKAGEFTKRYKSGLTLNSLNAVNLC